MDERNSPTGSTGLIDKVKQGATSQLSTQKDRATEGIGSVVEAVRQSSQQLRDNQHDTLAQYVDQAVGQLERFSNRLKEKNVGEILQEAQQLARRRPAVFIGSAFAIGLLGARFLKSSRDGQSGYRGDGRSAYGRGERDVYGVGGRDYTGDLRTGSSPAGTTAFDTGRI
jgi:hypothetical protein